MDMNEEFDRLVANLGENAGEASFGEPDGLEAALRGAVQGASVVAAFYKSLRAQEIPTAAARELAVAWVYAMGDYIGGGVEEDDD